MGFLLVNRCCAVDTRVRTCSAHEPALNSAPTHVVLIEPAKGGVKSKNDVLENVKKKKASENNILESGNATSSHPPNRDKGDSVPIDGLVGAAPESY